MKKVIYTLFIIVISVSCGSHTASETNVGKKDILMSALSIEPIDVKINEGSYMGFSGMYNDSLYFFDGYFNYCYTISIDGNVGTKKCGLGRGPGEIPVKYPLEAVYNESTKNLIALSGSNDVFVLENMKSVKRVPYKMGDNAGTSYTSPNSYTLWPEIVADCDNEYVYYNVQGNDDAVSIFRSDYYANAAIMLKVNYHSGDIAPFGRYSQYYAANSETLRHLPFTYFDVTDRGEVYVTHQADSLIHCYDSNFGLIHSFGFGGLDMDTQYSNPGMSEEQFANAHIYDMENKGYYYWVQHINDYTFRSYKKSSTALKDGLQIYKGTTLIGDVEVPQNFRVIGYVKPYFITKIICEESAEILKFYRFKLE